MLILFLLCHKIDHIALTNTWVFRFQFYESSPLCLRRRCRQAFAHFYHDLPMNGHWYECGWLLIHFCCVMILPISWPENWVWMHHFYDCCVNDQASCLMDASKSLESNLFVIKSLELLCATSSSTYLVLCHNMT